MDTNSYKLKVFNTLTGKYEETAVSKEVYDLCRRANQRDRDNSEKFYAHEIQFSSLIGNEDGCCENFHEFISDDHDPENLLCRKAELESVAALARRCSPDDRQLLEALYGRELSVKQYAAEIGEARTTVSSRKQKLLAGFRKDAAFKK